MLVPHPANVSQSTASDARSQTAAFPSDACTQADGTAQQTEQ